LHYHEFLQAKSALLLRVGPQGLAIALAAGAAALFATGAWLWRKASEQPPLELVPNG
jgi:hypothetical protein